MWRGPTRDRQEIEAWASKHDAVPAEIRPYEFDGMPTILYFLFGKEKEGTAELRPIGWDDFFARFEVMGLAMVFNDEPNFEILEDNSRGEAVLKQVL